MTVVIRPAEPTDAPDITAIWNRIIADTTVTFTTDLKTTDGIAADIAARQAAGLGYLVAVEEEQLLGLACYGPFRAGPGYAQTMEHTIYLAEGAQGQGLGRRLLTALEDHARHAGLRCLIAGISGENSGAQRFHAAQGYTEVGRLPQVGTKFSRALDLVLMQKLL